MRILLVEDDFASRRYMEVLLQPYGRTDVVVDGQEAIDAFRMAWEENDPYNLIFLDIMMPNVDGQEALQSIRNIEKEIGVKEVDQTKVIMTTVLEDPKNVVEAYNKGGATSYLVKPVDKEKLTHELSELGYYPENQ